jgi:hypothetical protein
MLSITFHHPLMIGSVLVLAGAQAIICPARIFSAQEFLPAPPADRTLIYTLDAENKLVPLPFEQGQTPLNPDRIAKGGKVSYVELKGDHSASAVKDDRLRIFLFTYQRQGAHPPFLVWLRPHRGARRVTAITQTGMRGFAIASEEIIKPTIRVLARDGDMVFMELRPRVSLVPGEYAIIGDDLNRIATFRLAETAPQ